MKFVDDTEFSVFIWRHLAPSLDLRKFVLDTNDDLTARLEEIVNENKEWRFSERNLMKFFEDTSESNKEVIEKLKECKIIVEKEREREFLDDMFGLNVSVEVKQLPSANLELSICLLTSIISVAIYPKDILSTSFLLSVLCPSVLPALRKLSVRRKLNMTQSLTSYVQKAVIDQNDGDEPELKENMTFLKLFLKTIEEIHDKFDEMKDPRKGIRAGFEVANKFLITCNSAGGSNLSPAMKVINSAIDEVVSNYSEIMKCAPNEKQRKPTFYNETERVGQSVVDRLTIMAPNTEVQSFSPNLRTPVQKVATPVSEKIASTPNTANKETPFTQTPATRSSTFINNQTPTPIRNPIQSLQDLIEAEKENIDPNGAVIVNPENKPNTLRVSRGKGLRVRKSTSNVNQSKRTPPQRSILSFFK